MIRSQVEPFLQRLNPNLKVVRHSNRGEHVYHGGLDAVYFYHKFVGGIPPGNIYVHKNELYKGKYKHRSLRAFLSVVAREGALLPHQRREAYAKLTTS